MNQTVPDSPAIIDGLREIAGDYDAILSDVWGVVHDGERANTRACTALRQARERGGAVVLITNAPRPARAVVEQIAGFGVAPETYDGVVSSGDVTVALMRRHGRAPFHFIGPQRDFSYLEMGWPSGDPLPPRVGLEDAAYVVCAGLVDDEIERPEDYDAILQAMRERGLTMICANPDLVVHRGARLAPCAGAIAARYEERGGKAIYAGKPHVPIYEMALAQAEQRAGRRIPRRRVLAIGDAMRTDVAGAVNFGIDVLFVTNGIHRGELHDAAGPLDPTSYRRFLGAAGARPRAAMPDLAW